MAYTIIIKHVAQISGAEQSRINEVDHLAFHSGPPAIPENEDGIIWAENEYYALGILDGSIVSLICLLRREVYVGDQKIRIAGIGGVATHPDFQRHGFAGLLLKNSEIFIREKLDVHFALLVCSLEREAYYQKYGWKTITDPMVFNTPNGKQTWPELTMVLSLNDQPWPSGLIDLCGPPW
jgi:aminoglycoside 2'-N-acetyltransferase I